MIKDLLQPRGGALIVEVEFLESISANLELIAILLLVAVTIELSNFVLRVFK